MQPLYAPAVSVNRRVGGLEVLRARPSRSARVNRRVGGLEGYDML